MKRGENAHQSVISRYDCAPILKDAIGTMFLYQINICVFYSLVASSTLHSIE